MDRRPASVTLAAWLVIVPASLGALLGTVLVATRSAEDLARSLEAFDPGQIAVARIISIAFLLTIGGLFVWVGASLLMLKRWARTVAIVLEAVLLVLVVPPLLAGSASIGSLIWQAVIPIAVIWSLMTARAIEAFHPPHEDDRRA